MGRVCRALQLSGISAFSPPDGKNLGRINRPAGHLQQAAARFIDAVSQSAKYTGLRVQKCDRSDPRNALPQKGAINNFVMCDGHVEGRLSAVLEDYWQARVLLNMDR